MFITFLQTFLERALVVNKKANFEDAEEGKVTTDFGETVNYSQGGVSGLEEGVVVVSVLEEEGQGVFFEVGEGLFEVGLSEGEEEVGVESSPGPETG
jgi:hypothetical protein